LKPPFSPHGERSVAGPWPFACALAAFWWQASTTCAPAAPWSTGGSPHGRGTCSRADRSNFRKSRYAFALNLDKNRGSRRRALSRLAARVGSNAAIRAAGKYRAGVMRFLIRMAFWIGVVLVLLPSAGNQPAPKSDIGAGDAMSAARAAVSD